jgi:transposase
MGSMISYPKAAMERAMKVQEVILRAIAKKITWWQATEIIGISDRHTRRWRERYEEFGFGGCLTGRRGKPSPKRVPVATLERVLELYRERYFDLNVRHFHEKLRGEHQIELSCVRVWCIDEGIPPHGGTTLWVRQRRRVFIGLDEDLRSVAADDGEKRVSIRLLESGLKAKLVAIKSNGLIDVADDEER